MGVSQNRRIVIADDHPVVLAGLVFLLRQISKLDIVAACSEGHAALAAILESKPDFACLDINMPGISGTEVVRYAKENGSRAEFILLTGSIIHEETQEALECGAIALFHKDSASEDLIQWFETRNVSPDLASGILEKNSEGLPKKLTAREREIAILASRGLTNKHIANQASISEGTVKIHLYNIFQKLRVSNRTELAAYASNSLTFPD